MFKKEKLKKANAVGCGIFGLILCMIASLPNADGYSKKTKVLIFFINFATFLLWS